MLESIDVVLAGSSMGTPDPMPVMPNTIARLAQSAERKALNLVVVGSSPTVGVFCSLLRNMCSENCRTTALWSMRKEVPRFKKSG